MNKSVALEAKHISKSYGSQRVIDAIDLEVQEGEILAIMGVSGAGKSTLLRMMAGLESYDAGSVEFEGEPLEKVEDVLVPGHEEIQYVAQDFRLLKNRTVLENIKEALLAFKDTFTSQKVDFLLQTLQLAHLREKRIELLSGGEKQRLAIARAMASEPAILLLDEPFTQLDQINKQILINALLEINQSLATTILLVTHQADEVFQLAHRVGVLHEAELLQLDSTENIYHKPISYEVAALFGNLNRLAPTLIATLHLADTSNNQYAIRPQHITIAVTEQANWIAATVKRNVFMGTHRALSVDTAQQKGLLIHTDIDKLIEAGDQIFIQILTEHLLKWPKR